MAIVWPRLAVTERRSGQTEEHLTNGATEAGPKKHVLTGRLGKTPRQGGRGEGERIPLIHRLWRSRQLAEDLRGAGSEKTGKPPPRRHARSGR